MAIDIVPENRFVSSPVASFVVNNKPNNGKRFLQALGKVFLFTISLLSFIVSNYGEWMKSSCSVLTCRRLFALLQQERHDLAERVMVTRLHLYGKWAKVMNEAFLSCKPFLRTRSLDFPPVQCSWPRLLLWFSWRNAITQWYTRRYRMRTWSWCGSGSLRQWYGLQMTQTRRRSVDGSCPCPSRCPTPQHSSWSRFMC